VEEAVLSAGSYLAICGYLNTVFYFIKLSGLLFPEKNRVGVLFELIVSTF